jgi:serine protease Do
MIVRDPSAKASALGAPLRQLRLLLIVPLLLAAAALPAGAQIRPAPESFADLVESLLPTVVNIATTQVVKPDREFEEFEEFFKEFFDRRGLPPRSRRSTSLGSGFIVREDGYIVTNNHVISNADEITVRLYDDTVLTAEIIGRDEKTDLALLKVESDKPLPAVKWGDSDMLRVGDWVIAIGNPLGLGGTVTAGIVSALQRDIQNGPYDDFIQTDASINRGNSGGPMFGVDGSVMGVNTAIFSPSGGSIGIGFAIPSAMAQNVIDQLLEFGTVRRGWLGVRIQTVTDELAEGLRLEDARGALVASVTPDSPAAEAGLQQGDVILKFAGREIDTMRKLPRLVAETRIGDEVDVLVRRKGEDLTIKVKIAALEEEEPASAEAEGAPSEGEAEDQSGVGEVAALGLSLAKLTPELRRQFQIDEQVEGVVVTNVDVAGAAAEKGLQAGDVIVEVDQEVVSSPGDVSAGIASAKEGGHRVVTLLVYREGDFQWVAVRIDKG